MASLCSPISVWVFLCKKLVNACAFLLIFFFYQPVSELPAGLVGIDFTSLVHPFWGFLCKKLGNACAFLLFGIGFALLAHPFWEFLCKKQERCRVFLVLFSTRLVSELSAGHKTKQENFQFSCFLRRGRDSCFGKRLRRLRTPTRVFSSPLMQKRKP